MTFYLILKGTQHNFIFLTHMQYLLIYSAYFLNALNEWNNKLISTKLKSLILS
jgi:hypothetical protein